MKKLIDAAGAGASFTSPGWLTQLGRLWGGKSVRPTTWALRSRAGTGTGKLCKQTCCNTQHIEPPTRAPRSPARAG